MQVTVESVKDGLVTLEREDGSRVTAPAALFSDAAAGDVYDICKNEKETAARKQRIGRKMEKLFRD